MREVRVYLEAACLDELARRLTEATDDPLACELYARYVPAGPSDRVADRRTTQLGSGQPASCVCRRP
jgi:hypothetical protein